uniref:RNA-directed DNA polymerase, eukaryota, reverse transcriptase zinc-binding domain protein n=1 Tax=Tanacetum cinerariifolium TaxID=118510 RepID=A0A699GKM6_TANCI|nr:RNA-directed DNA polymerase, eukaryota, reverse transcriptase zinc-binding domain protein [Tanacetum cinerariifolium]
MQALKSKVDMGKALDVSLFLTKSSGTKSEVQDESNKSRNDTYADGASIKPVYDKEPMDDVLLATECNIFATGQQYTVQPGLNNEGRVDQEHDRRVLQDYLLEIDSRLDKGESLPDDLPNYVKTFHDIGVIDGKIPVDMVKKAKVKWAIEGDKNSKFSAPDWSRVLVEGIFPRRLGADAFHDLEGDMFVDEIEKAVWDHGSEKSLVKEFFNSSIFPNGRNPSFIALIPKIDERKRTWVCEVMAQKEYGGLGVSSLYALNRALMFKWIKPFLSSQLVASLKSKGVDLLGFCKKMIGNGNNSKFLDALVAQKIQNPDFAVSFRIRPRVVKSAREEIDKHLLVTSSSSTRWSKLLPIKLNVFAWRMFLDKFPTRINLSKRGLDIPCVLCPNCGNAMESRDISSMVVR